ncbi:MAG TPA: hypothetical protein DHV48_10640 [Prolixibacteraceae bacterium]|nr:hypothetical protein [Prolixibacteraceae bacterium]
MRIYNYLFYKSYLLAQRSRNFDDIPVLGGMIFVIACVMFNIFAISFVLEGAGLIDIDFKEKYKYPFSFGLIGILLFYYLYKGRYKKIVEKYSESSKNGLQIHPILVIIFYYLISFFNMLIAGMYKNNDWIFSNL